MDYCEHKKKLMKNPEFRRAHKALEAELEAEYQHRREEARQRIKYQTDLARALGITVEQLIEEMFQ